MSSCSSIFAPIHIVHQIELSLWDTQSDQNYNLLRNLAYAYTDVFLVCYCIANPESLENVTKWNLEVFSSEIRIRILLDNSSCEEMMNDEGSKLKKILQVRKSCPKASVILIGTKKDLRPSKPAEVIFMKKQ